MLSTTPSTCTIPLAPSRALIDTVWVSLLSLSANASVPVARTCPATEACDGCAVSADPKTGGVEGSATVRLAGEDVAVGASLMPVIVMGSVSVTTWPATRDLNCTVKVMLSPAPRKAKLLLS